METFVSLFGLVKHYLQTIEVNEELPYLMVYADNRYYIHYYKDEKSWKEYRGSFNVMDIENDKLAEAATFLNFVGDEHIPNIEFRWVDGITLRLERRKEIKICLKEALTSEDSTNAKLIREELKEDKGKIVSFDEGKTYSMLVCAVSSDEDYYYLSIDKKMKTHYCSCVGKYQIIDDESVIKEYKQWLSDNLKKIQDTINVAVYQGFDVPFTNSRFLK